MLLYITYGDIVTAESMKTTTLLERLFFTSYVMMSDLKFQASRKWMIIMLTELGVRGGPSLSLSLDRAETILVIDVHLHWCGPNAVGSLGALAWPLGGFWFVLPVPGMWACCFGFVCLPRAVGFCLVFVGCASMWVLGFVVQFCLVVCVGCTRMWVIGLCLSSVFLYRADAPFPLF